MKKLLVLFLLVFTAITVSAQKSSNIVFDYDYCYDKEKHFDCEGTIYFGYKNNPKIIIVVTSEGKQFEYKVIVAEEKIDNDGEKYLKIKVKEFQGNDDFFYFVIPYRFKKGVVFLDSENNYLGFKNSKYD